MRLFDLFLGRKSVDRKLRLGLVEAEFGITSKTAAISFIATFGISKALSNLFAGHLAQRVTRRRILNRWMADRSAGTFNLDLGAGLGLGDRGQRPAGYQPRVDLVDDSEYEDGPGWP